MQKANPEEFYEKYKKFILYVDKMKSLNNITKGHKQRFINIIIEFLKYKEKDLEIQIWIYYLLINYKKEITKYKKFVDEPVVKKLEQLLSEFMNKNLIFNKKIDNNGHQNNKNSQNNKNNQNNGNELFSSLFQNEHSINNINNGNNDNNLEKYLFDLQVEEKIFKFEENKENKENINMSNSLYINYNNNYNYFNNLNANYENGMKKEEKKLEIYKENPINKALTQNNNNNNNSNICSPEGNGATEAESKLKKKIAQMISKIKKYNSVKDYILSSINKEHKNNKIFCEIYQFAINNLLCKESESTREKLLLLICIIFPFISNKQKQQLLIMENKFKSDTISYLKRSKLFVKSKNNNLYEFFIKSIINNELNKELILKIFHKNLFIFKSDDLFELYQLYLITKIFDFEFNSTDTDELLTKISFKIKFILKNYNSLYISRLGANYDSIFWTLCQINNFYNKVYKNRIIDDDNNDGYDNGKGKGMQLYDFISIKNNNNDGNKFMVDDLDVLFSKEENKLYDNFFRSINKFYKIDNVIDLISGYAKELKNYEFCFNLIELLNFKNDFIKNNFKHYKDNLIRIERFIYGLGRQSLFPINIYNMSKYSISYFTINPYFKSVFYSLNTFLHEKLYSYKFKLYPYGSVTEFLSDQESDIDLFLDISEIELNEQKVSFLYGLIHWIKYFDKSVNSTISTRVCVISFTFKKVSFDISIVGFCPYLHSCLIREYSLIDPRFPLLIIAIKYIVKVLKINNISEDKNHLFLNSFSWVLLLVAFLQDIVYPPVLPKILTNSEIFTQKAFFGNNKVEKEEEEKSIDKSSNDTSINVSSIKHDKNGAIKNKNFDSFINNMEKEDMQIPSSLGNVNFRIKNYKNQISEKNEMSCSELLLKFLEFVIFYFKYDAVFVNCSFTYEGFQNFKNINDIINNDNKEDKIFMNYFNRKYIKKNNKGEKSYDGYFLIRDPFDPRYNPAQTMKASSLKKFFARLKMVYFNLIRYGSLEYVIDLVDNEEKKEKSKK